MGGCALTDRKKNSPISLQLSSIYSLDYKSTKILKYSQSGELEQYSLSCLSFLPKFSAYTHLAPYLFIVGGTDESSPLRNDCLRINLTDLTLDYQASLPHLSKHGDLYTHLDILYYLGAVQVSNYSAVPTPFMRLCKDSSAWEYLHEVAKPGTAPDICSQLLRPGSCKVENCIYVIGGEFVKGPGIKTLNSAVYRLDLDTLGVELVAPRCIPGNGGIVVLGGFVGDRFNYEIWMLGEKRAKIGEQRVKVSGNKPVGRIAGCFVLIGNNNIKRLREDRMTWKVEEIRRNDVKVVGDIGRILNVKKKYETPGKISICVQNFEATEKSPNYENRVESRKLSPSNLFNSQLDFEYSNTFQVLPQRELSGINSIIENYEINN